MPLVVHCSLSRFNVNFLGLFEQAEQEIFKLYESETFVLLLLFDLSGEQCLIESESFASKRRLSSC